MTSSFSGEWEIEPGHTLEGFTFNGQVPGPTIEARVGEKIVVRLNNRLPKPTVIHWHGLRVPGEMDGTELVQRLVEPGETFEYALLISADDYLSEALDRPRAVAAGRFTPAS